MKILLPFPLEPWNPKNRPKGDFSLTEKIFGYVKTFRNYLQTDKGKHDFTDYMRAGFAILVTTMILRFILRLV